MCVNDGLISCVCLKRKTTKDDLILMLYLPDVFICRKDCYAEKNMDICILHCFKEQIQAKISRSYKERNFGGHLRTFYSS